MAEDTITIAETESTSAEYSAYREDITTSDAINNLVELAATPSDKEVQQIDEPKEEATKPGGGSLADVLRANSDIKLKVGANIARGAGAVAKDVAIGAFEFLPSVAGGILQDVPEGIIGAVDDAAQALTELQVGNPEEVAKVVAAVKASRPDLIPDFEQPRSVTGKITRELASFSALFVPFFNQFAGAKVVEGGVKAVKLGRRVAAGGGAAGIAGFFLAEEADESVEEFLAQNPTLREPVEAFVNADSDTGAEKMQARLVNGLVFAGLGAFVETGIGFFKAYRAGRAARAAARGPAESTTTAGAKPTAAPEALPEVAAERISLGDEAAPRFKIVTPGEKALAKSEKVVKTTLGEDVTAAELKQRAAIEGTRVEINMARIDTGEEVKTLIQEVTDVFHKSVSKARRGTRNNATTQEAADQLGISLEEMLARRNGVALNAEEGLAFRKIHASMAEQLEELARKSADVNAGAADHFKFRRALVVFQAVNNQMMGARAEAGRALQAWRISAGGNAERFARMAQLMDTVGGGDVSAELAKQMIRAADAGFTPGQMNQMLKRSVTARTMDAVRESFTLGLLWSPRTHLTNIAGNSIVIIQQIYERWLAGRLSQAAARAGNEGVAPGEAQAMTFGLLRGIQTVLRGGADLPGGAATKEALAGFNKIDLARTDAISSEAFQISSDTAMGRFVDLWGWMTRRSGKALQAEDSVFKTIGFQMELHAQANRQAYFAGGTRRQIAARMDTLLNNPPENIRMAAVSQASYQTFTDKPGILAQSIMKLRDGDTIPFMFVLVPFARTPARIMSYSFERSPLAPVMGKFRADVAAGGARKDLALARMASGTMLSMWMADLAFQGHVTGAGPSEPGQREAMIREGWQPFSIRVGDKWFRYNRLDPFGMLAGTAASMAETMRGFEIDGQHEADMSEIAAAMITAVSETVMDKAYFTGISNVMKALEEPDRYGSAFIENTLSAFVPFSSALRTAEQAGDPTFADPIGTWQKVQSLIPVLQSKLPKRRDLWGDAHTAQEVYGRVFDVVSPVRVTQDNPQPIDAEIVKHRMDIHRIRRVGSWDGARVNFRDFPNVYDAYVILAGNEVTHPLSNKGAKDFLNDLVTGKSAESFVYTQFKSDGPEGTKRDYIQSWINTYRKLARREIMTDPDGRFRGEEFERFREYVGAESERVREAQTPPVLQ